MEKSYHNTLDENTRAVYSEYAMRKKVKKITTSVRMSREQHADLRFLRERIGGETLSDAICTAVKEAADRRREIHAEVKRAVPR